MTFEGMTGQPEDFQVHFLTHDRMFRLDLGFRCLDEQWTLKAQGDVRELAGWKRLHTVTKAVSGPLHYMVITDNAGRLRRCMFHALKDYAAELATR